ncbi:hypothetical protein TKK_0016586 [Trichogramma kaykai]|uniref:Uncharacterized protein n=1 Tax=Trichogramma kaykai TaxID=54128 RepID=A0ABD2W6G0_9HYME
MRLPCKHIFKLCCLEGISTFNPTICARRWEKDYFTTNHRATAGTVEPTPKKLEINKENRSVSTPIKIQNSSRSPLSSIENVNVQKKSIFHDSGLSSPLMFESESDEEENSPPSKVAKYTFDSSPQPHTVASKSVLEPKVDQQLSCSPSNHDVQEIDGVPYMVPNRNPCGRRKGAILNAFGLKVNTCQLEPYHKQHRDIRAEMIIQRIIRSEVLVHKEYGVHLFQFHELYHNLPCWIFDENVEIDIVADYFEEEAFKQFTKLYESTDRNQVNWTCDICINSIDEDYSICCDRCLSWVHFKCQVMSAADVRKHQEGGFK